MDNTQNDQDNQTNNDTQNLPISDISTQEQNQSIANTNNQVPPQSGVESAGERIQDNEYTEFTPETPAQPTETAQDTQVQHPQPSAVKLNNPQELQLKQQVPQNSDPNDNKGSTTKKGSIVILKIGIVLLIVSVITGAAYFILQNGKESPDQENVDAETTVQTTTAPQLPSPTPDPSANWSGYSAQYFTFKYPKNTVVGSDEKIVDITMRGPTQTDATELFDGYSVSFETVENAGKTPEGYAESLIAKTKNEGISEITKEPSPIQINEYSGVTYTEEGLGTYKKIVLGTNKSSALIVISVLVADPENSGYRETVDQILSSFKFIEGM